MVKLRILKTLPLKNACFNEEDKSWIRLSKDRCIAEKFKHCKQKNTEHLSTIKAKFPHFVSH